MKKASDYLNPFKRADGYIELHSGDAEELLKIIKQVQLDAISAAVNECAANAETKEEDYYCDSPNHEDGLLYHPITVVDIESIMILEDKLKKQLDELS